ncbi:MAG: nuclear transport factor 2 family protein, partial [Rhodospirillaceae bacterium]|nr:nuclear transport factor 2 family protein [Rhodospirillaceae bacterium]
EDFLARRSAAAESFSNGDAASFLALIPTQGEVTFHSPDGTSLLGATAVKTVFASHAASFRRGGESRFEILQKGASGDLGFWTGAQIARVHIAGREEPQEMRIRITEVFRRFAGAWMLIHRHADLAAPRPEG